MKATFPSTIYPITNLPNYQILSAPFMRQPALKTLSLSITSLPGVPAFHSLLTDCTLPAGPLPYMLPT
jgi:hypothetical protein